MYIMMIRAAYFTTRRLLGGARDLALSFAPALQPAVKHECFIKFLIKPMHTHT